MREKKLKQQLKYYRIPKANLHKKEETRKELQKLQIFENMTDLQFVIGQFQFIPIRTWIGQFAVLAMVCFVLCSLKESADCQMLSMLSAMTPLLIVFQIEEFSKVFYKSILEIELATKYSLKKLLLSRMCILGSADVLVLGILMLVLRVYFEESLMLLLLYSLVPFNITVTGLFYLLRFLNGRKYGYCACAYTAFVSACFVMLEGYRPFIYSRNYQDIWIIGLFITTGMLIKFIWNFQKEIGNSERLLQP